MAAGAGVLWSSMADAQLEALRSSVTRLRALTADMTESELAAQAYPTEWSVADVLSHLGSSALITIRRLDDSLAGRATPADFAPGVWDIWNAKDPIAKRDDALDADAALLARLGTVTGEERASFKSALGPMLMDFTAFVSNRLNEHAVHTWDVEVVRRPAATIPHPASDLVVDNLSLVTRFTARPAGEPRRIRLATTDPERGFVIEWAADAVHFDATPGVTGADLALPAEAFIRLVYGRLDPDHTPGGVEGEEVALLRRVFPGP